MNTQTQEDKHQNLAAAICAVMSEVKRLEKADKNAFANYKFTSVDDFKDAVRPLMAKHGLSLHINEKSFDIKEFESTDKAGKPKKITAAIFKYTLRLYHIGGGVSKPENRSVAFPFVGAQTSGIALSYTIKEWFKSRFLVSSGDQNEEADLMDNTTELRLSKQAARDLSEELDKEMNSLVTMRDLDALRSWWREEYYRIKTLPTDWEVTLKTKWAREGQALSAQEGLDKSSNDDLDAIAQEQEEPNILLGG